GAEGRGPIAQEVVENGVEPLCRRIPRLHEVMVELDEVDAVDCDLGVGVGRKEHLARVRENLSGLDEELRAAHLRIRASTRNSATAALRFFSSRTASKAWAPEPA